MGAHCLLFGSPGRLTVSVPRTAVASIWRLIRGGVATDCCQVLPSDGRSASQRGMAEFDFGGATVKSAGAGMKLVPTVTTRRTSRLLLLAVVFLAFVTSFSVLLTPQSASAATTASDNFNRANGSLGADWTDMTVGGLAISNDAVVGTGTGNSGDLYRGATFGSDQFSQIEVTSTRISGGQWVGPEVRAQNGGQRLYVGIYSANDGKPELELFKLIDGSWTQLGSAYASGPLAAGTTLRLSVTGSTLSFSKNGVVELRATDASLTGGAPGIMAYGTPSATDWVGGDATAGGAVSGTVGSANVTHVSVTRGSRAFSIHYVSTARDGIRSYTFTSVDDGDSPQTLRVLQPTHPAVGVAHNFLYVLPVEAGLGDKYGDGLKTMAALHAENEYNLTIVEPTFAIDPWYANNPSYANRQYETFMTKDLEPWVKANLSTSGSEQNWLIGFSKSGYGVQDLILKYPNLFQLAASWDFPADMSSYDQYGTDPAADYGTEANFASNYQLSSAFVTAHRASFLTSNRIWIGGYDLYQYDLADYDKLLTSAGILHTMGPSVEMAHKWGSGWVPEALAALHQDSTQLA
jgi:hypothetical protein